MTVRMAGGDEPRPYLAGLDPAAREGFDCQVSRFLPSLIALVAALWALPSRAENVRERDLEALVRRSTVVARGEVVGLTPDGADLHLLAIYVRKGEPGAVQHVRSEGAHSLQPSPGDRGLFFLAPSSEQPGTLAFVQEDSERWPVEPEVDQAVDAFMHQLVIASAADAPQPSAALWLEGLSLSSPSLSAHSARRLAALARRGALASEDWDHVLDFLQSPGPSDDAKAVAVVALADVLPADRTLAMLPRAKEGSRLKAALVAAMGARAGSGKGAREKARQAIGEAGRGESPELALAAAQALAQLGDESAVPTLERALAGKDAQARQGAVEALVKLTEKGSRTARSRLYALFDDPDGLVRARARQAWTSAHLADPERQQRTHASLLLVCVALVLILGVGAHVVIDRRRG
jgi:hypothetical protein